MLKNKTKKIGESTYWVSQLSPLKAISFGAKVFKVLGPALEGFKGLNAGMIKDMKDSAGEEADLDKIIPIVAGVAEGLDPDALEGLIELCLTKCGLKKDGNTVENVDASFGSEDPMHLIKVSLFVLEVNFKSFLEGQGFLKAESPST